MMLTLSALYNMVESDRWSDIFRRLDHSGIYFKIAGTYTPFLLLSGVQVTTFLIGIWSSAFLGSFLKMLDPDRFRWFGLVLYLAMGWAAVWLGNVILVELPLSLLILMISGGIVYTVGVAFFLYERLRFHNTIWHVFVLVGSMFFFAAVAYRIALIAIR
jgi:hemolysin III